MKKFISIAMSTAMAVSMMSGAVMADETEDAGFDPGTGKVYYLNFKPEVDQQW